MKLYFFQGFFLAISLWAPCLYSVSSNTSTLSAPTKSSWLPSVTIDAEQAGKIFEAAGKEVGESISTSLGTTIRTETTAAIQQINQVAHERLEQANQVSNARLEQFANIITLGKEKQIEVFNHALNKARLIPGFTVGTVCLIACVNMYWQALNDYLNGTDAITLETQHALYKKIMGKIKAGSGFLVFGALTLYYNTQFAHALLGYELPASVVVA